MNISSKDQTHLRELIIQAKNGDSSAFEEVYKTYYTPLYRYIYSRVKNTDEAEDLTQTVFIKVWNALPNWNESHTSPLSFFFTVAKNSMIDFFRKASNREIVSDELILKHVDLNTESDKDSNANELKEVLEKLIIQLSEEQQEIITLYYTNDFTYKEIASITGKREDAIRQIHSRAIKKLRTLYNI